jgi:hypothetical protein
MNIRPEAKSFWLRMRKTNLLKVHKSSALRTQALACEGGSIGRKHAFLQDGSNIREVIFQLAFICLGLGVFTDTHGKPIKMTYITP